jgi:hypothetical protein
MIDDSISKPSAGRFFPMSAKEVVERIKQLCFKVHSYNDRLSLMLQNCEPKSAQLMLKRFGFSQADKRFTLNIPDQSIYAFKHCFVVRLPAHKKLEI